MEIRYKGYTFPVTFCYGTAKERSVNRGNYYACRVYLRELGQKYSVEHRRKTFEELELAVQVRIDGLIRRMENKITGHHEG